MHEPTSNHSGVVPLGVPVLEPGPKRSLAISTPKLIAAILAGAAAILVVVGTFVPYEQLTAEMPTPFTVEALPTTILPFSMSTTSWQRTFDDPTGFGTILPGHPALYGIPFFVAAVALLMSAAFIAGWRATPQVTKISIVASATATGAMVAMLAAEASAYVSSAGNGLGDNAEIGPALWLFAGGAACAVAGAVITLLPDRKIPGADLPTPPMGFAMPPAQRGEPRPPQIAVIPEAPPASQ